MQFLMWALVMVESSWNPLAVSPANARGLTQMTPIAVEQVRRETGQQMTPNLFNPEVSLKWGTTYFEWCLGQTGQIEEAIAYYNGGGRAARQYENGSLNPETRKYVPKVLLYYYLQLYGTAEGS